MGPKEFYWDTVQGQKNMRGNEWRWRPGAAIIYSVGANSTESQMFLLFIVILLNNMSNIPVDNGSSFKQGSNNNSRTNYHPT